MKMVFSEEEILKFTKQTILKLRVILQQYKN